MKIFNLIKRTYRIKTEQESQIKKSSKKQKCSESEMLRRIIKYYFEENL
jgi:hypothetical protein